MNAKITVDFSGNVTDLVAFLEVTFKDPGALILNVSAAHIFMGSKAPHEALVEKCLQEHPAQSNSASICSEMLRIMPSLIKQSRSDQKIQAIKAIREVTGLGLKESKDMLEGPIQSYIEGSEL